MPSSSSLSSSSSSYATSWSSSSRSSSMSSSSSSMQTSKTSRLTEIQEELKEIIELQKERLQVTEQEITDKQLSNSDKLSTTKQTELQESNETPAKYAADDYEHPHRKHTLWFKYGKKLESEESLENASEVRITIEEEPSSVTSHSSTSQKMKTSMSYVNIQPEENVEPNIHSLYDYNKAKLPASDVMKHDVISSNEWLSSHSEYSPIAIAMQFKDGLEKGYYHTYNSNYNNHHHNHHHENRYNQYEPHNIHQWEDKQKRTHLEWRQKESQEKNLRLRQEELYKLELETRLINRHKGALSVSSMSTSQLQKSIDYLWLSRSEKMKHKLKREILLQKTRKQPTTSIAEQENQVEPNETTKAVNVKKEHKHNKDDDNKENKNEKMKVNDKEYIHDEQGFDVSALHNVAAMTLNKPLKAANANIFFCNNNINNKNNKSVKSINTKGKALIDTNAGELYYYYNKGFRLLQYV